VIVPATAWAHLEALRGERKFVPHAYPPLGYTGADTREDLEPLTQIVDRALDEVLALRAPQASASVVRPILREANRRLGAFATEDRDRAWGYLVEIWSVLGFRGALFDGSYGEAFSVPEGYAEPLPPGWIAPDRPRQIG
jgi:hypothetical protein